MTVSARGIAPVGRGRARAVPAHGAWHHGRHSGRSGTRSYDLYVPAGCDGKVPLVLLLHGCRQTSVRFAEESGFRAAADREGLVLLVPQQEARHQFQRCWRWYDETHQGRGSGEPAILVDLVRHVLRKAAAGTADRWHVDERRVYSAGLSAGGAMALILATAYPDVFAATGLHSATAYRSATRPSQALAAMTARGDLPPHSEIATRMAPVVVVHGLADQLVRPANSDRIVDQWLASWDRHPRRGLDRVRPMASTQSQSIDGRRTFRTRWYTAKGRRVLEYWRIDGLGHAWSGGHKAGDYVDVAGPDATALITAFFARHRAPAPRTERRPWWRFWRSPD